MTTTDNEMIVRRFYEEVLSQGKVEVLDEIVDQNFMDHGEALFGSPKGREILKQSISATHGILDKFTVTLEEIIAEGDLVGVRGTMRCIHRGAFLGVAPTGNELTWKGIAMFRLEGGKIEERWFNSDSISILRQLGLTASRVQDVD